MGKIKTAPPELVLERDTPVRDINVNILGSGKPSVNRCLIGTAVTGLVRIEWATARYGAATPCNWSTANYFHMLNDFYPLEYQVADAQNLIVRQALSTDMEWVFLLEHDVVIPPDCFIRLNQYMITAEYPVVSGLYWLRAHPTEPLVYKGLGNGAYVEWMPTVNKARERWQEAVRIHERTRHPDDKKQAERALEDYEAAGRVWVDGVPTGCLLIHHSVLRLMWDESPEYAINTVHGQQIVRRVFETPTRIWRDPQTGHVDVATGTSDLEWCRRVMKQEVLERAGWRKHMKAHKKYPYLMDSNISCKHINVDGEVFP